MEKYEEYYYEFAKNPEGWNNFPRQNITECLRAHLKGGEKILEVGCGTAEILNFLPGNIFYTGLEKSAYAIEKIRRELAEKPGVDFIVNAPPPLPFPEARLDVVLLIFSLEHMKKPRELLLECKRVLRKGGKLIIAAPNLEFPLAKPNAIRHWSYWARSGFKLTRLFDYLRRILGSYSFRTLKENYSSATGKYEKKDDDLWYVASSWEVIRFLEKNGFEIKEFWEERKISGWRKLVKILPAMRWYGLTLAAVFEKKVS